MNSYFSENYNILKYPKVDEETSGLRNAQLRTIHTISSFFTLNETKLDVVFMPTGSGKTAVLMMTLYALEARKVLVITPSKILRSQVSGECSTLKTLIKVNVLPENIKRLKVFEMVSLYKEDHEEMKEQDRVLRGKIVAVQPSICKSMDIPDKIQEVLAATNYYISNSGKVKSFEIWVS